MGNYRLDGKARSIAIGVLGDRAEPDSSFERLLEALNEDAVALLCVMNDDVKPSKGKTVWATARKISGREAYAWSRWTDLAAPCVLVIEINEEMWGLLNRDSREALIAHELLHFTADFSTTRQEWSFGIVGHDLEEFKKIVGWYGVDWRPNLREFADALEEARTGQSSLIGLVDEETGEIMDAAEDDTIGMGRPHLDRLSRPVDGVESVTFSHLDAAGNVVSSATIGRPS